MRNSRNAGLLYGVMPPSTNTNVLLGSVLSHCSISGGKYTGAAELARTSCQRGIRRLQSGRPGSLYFASGLLPIGHGESVVTLRVTTRSRHFRLSGDRSASVKTSRSFVRSGSAV